jgi:diguanylate cyclase (GGDEF)-like protein
MAYYDQLTELPNKEYLKDVLENEMEGKNSALFLINCDNFNLINLSLGYKFGDQLIKETALQIKKLTDENKRLFRFEEDKFILLFENYPDDHQLEELIESINNEIEAVSLKSKFDNQYLSSSIAVEKDINQYGSVEEIMNNLNIVLDYVKSSSSNYLFFNQQMKEKINRKDEIEKELRESIRLEDERIHLNYQPIFDLKEQKIAAFEALARLKTNKYGNVSPEEFIQIAEDRHLIIPLSKLILKKASKFSAKLDKYGFKKLKVSVNMSGLDLIQEDFTENIISIIRKNGAKTENIKVEITESVLLNNFDLINLKLSQLKKEGITSALDDFGTGYSSFYRMTELNIDLVKIDKYFINKINKGTENSIVAAAIIELSHSLGLSVIAERVETEAEKDYLIENNCDYIQGYLFSRPLSEKDAFVLLKNFKV